MNTIQAYDLKIFDAALQTTENIAIVKDQLTSDNSVLSDAIGKQALAA
jgi:hypothetical protein